MYLTPAQARTRLIARYDVEAELTIGDLMLASDELDQMAPFEADVDVENLPDALLDWVALRAHHIAAVDREGFTATRADVLSKTYAWPQLSRTARRLEKLVAPYLKRTGVRL